MTSRAVANSLLALGFVAVVSSPALARKHDAPPAAAASAQAAPVTAADLVPALEGQLKAAPGDVSVAMKLSDAYLQAGRPNDALRITSQLIKGGVKTAQVYFFDGVAKRQLGALDQATASLEIASTLDATSAPVLIELTNVYMQAGRLGDATRVAERAVKFNPQDERSALNAGVVYAVQKRYDDARAQFTTASLLAAKDPLPLLLEARTYVDQNQTALALPLYDRAIALDPTDVTAYESKAGSLGDQHQVAGAIATYEQIYAIVPKPELKAEVLTQEARLYVKENQNDQALAVLQREVASFNALPEAHIALGDFYNATNKNDLALQQWTIAAGPDRSGRAGLSRLGDVALRNGDNNGAIADFSRILEIDHNDDSALFHLGQAYEASNQFDKARSAFRQAFAIRKTPQALAQIGASAFFLHDYRDAAAAFDDLSTHQPDFLTQDPHLLFIMGKTYELDNQKSKARSAYARLLGFVKPGSTDERTLKGLIASIDHQSSGSRAPSKPAHKAK